MARSILRKRRRRFGHPAQAVCPRSHHPQELATGYMGEGQEGTDHHLVPWRDSLWDGHLPVFQHTHCLIFLEQAAPTTRDLPKMAFLPVAETWGTVTGFCWQPAASMLSSSF